ncbi:hypothetical protein A2966_03715 [Candidatus Roizmanbacteria bacterium RIFCSPLOWO2_01_FULL_41_22]|uniref:SHS2 domain-containing protein n=2 Tax=Candidatus Roizmaniibacteriota TaxID=1752723 RepID=A0A1F7JQ36_9BACT|nr:MAG: hypothetical protein A2966_03715 [Candidatus Roizmanbacteria bacterium RIFCSPLOWO2_01_FULL_41_22]OGK57729.1 MAG: hypothetical protein A3H86_03370 [Candidatus Roizmanbacteria bacterium RIFCSPLOWO2_02_FULL_41_9]
MSKDTFSIDITRKNIRVCDLEEKDGKIEILSLGYDDIVPNFLLDDNPLLQKEQAKKLLQLYQNLKISKKKVNVVLPDSVTYSQIIEMPKLNEQELMLAIRYQADEFIPMPIDEVYLDIEVLKEDPKNSRQLTLIIAAPKNTVTRIYNMLSLAHLVPKNLENELSVIGRLIALRFSQSNECTVLVNFGFSGTSLYLVDPLSHIIVATRSFKIGLDLIVRDLKVNLNWDEKNTYEALKNIGLTQNATVDIYKIIYPIMKEMFRELEQFIQLAKSKYNLEVNKVYLFNFDSSIANFAPTIQSNMSVPTLPLPIGSILIPNVITQSFSSEISSFVSVIAAQIK